ncbi:MULTISPECIES: hypothetical protein [unclassified Microcoleus]|uniref:hypothetical protein n=1 Tax=unclassified Microcoleus TaxID=2642155 RepID=UPI0025D728EA|nr:MULTISPECIES: hypothetical protein [unclassified Microcoleus]
MNAIVKYTGGGAIAPALVGKVKAFDTAPSMLTTFQGYYGFDPSAFAGMSEEELGAFVDSVEKIKLLVDNLDKLEKHVNDYIDGVVKYNEFVARCVKSGAKGMETIDKATLDVFLAWKGWQNNTKMLAKDSDVAVRLLDQELTDYSDLAEYDLTTSLKVMANRLKRRKEALDKKPEQEEANFSAQQETKEARSEEKRRFKDLIAYGSRGKYALPPSSSPQLIPSSNTGTATAVRSSEGASWIKKWGGKAFDFFSGK